MPYFHFPQSPVSTPDNDFVTIPAFFTYDGGDGDDFIVGDAPIAGGFFVAPTGNGSSATAFSIDDAAKWVSSGFTLPGYMNVSAPTTTVYVSGEGEYESFTFSVTSGDVITLDVDFANFNSRVAIYDENGTFVAVNDVGAGDQGDLIGTESFLTYTATSTGTYRFVLQESDGSAMDVGDQAIVNVSVTGHATSSTPTLANQTLLGGAGNDQIYAGHGDDTVEGGTGDDYLDGGLDTDTLSYANSLTGVTANLDTGVVTGEGTDTVLDFEAFIGSSLADVVTLSADTSGGFDIDLGGGDDTLVSVALGNFLSDYNGGAGSDSFDYSATAFGVSPWTANLETEELSFQGSTTLVSDLIGFENISGSQVADIITGNAEDNILMGNGGDDIISGGLGNDTLDGGAGDNDTVTYAASLTGVTANLNTGNVTGEGTDTLAGFEVFIGSSEADDVTLSSGAGGGIDVDLGDEDDTLILLSASNFQSNFNGGVGIDTFDYSAGGVGVNPWTFNLVTEEFSFVNGAAVVSDLIDFENIRGTQGVDIITGNAEDNILIGNGGADVIDAGEGANTLEGGLGDDTLTAGAGDNDFNGGAGTDTINAGNGNNDFFIDDMAHLVVGAETMNGGSGTDTLWLGTGDYDLRGTTLGSLDQINLNADGASVTILSNDLDNTALATNLDIQGTSTAGEVQTFIIDMTGDTNVTLTALDFIDWGVEDIFIVNGSTGNDRIQGSNTVDILNGGDGRDNFVIVQSFGASAYGQDTYDGGADAFDGTLATADVLEIFGGISTNETFDLTGATFIGLEALSIRSNNANGAITTTLQISADQMGGLASNAVIQGSSQSLNSSVLEISMDNATTLNLSGWTFVGWTDGNSRIEVNGDSDGEDISGSSRGDIIYGNGGGDNINAGAGADEVYGGAGNDNIYINGAANWVVGGETVDGGGDSDSLILQGAGNEFDFTGSTVTSIENIMLFDDGIGAIFTGDQFGAGVSNTATVEGSGATATAESLTINITGNVNFSQLQFANWGTQDVVTINGDATSQTISGTTQFDIINSGSGDDVINYTAGNDSVDMGDGNDRIQFNGTGVYDGSYDGGVGTTDTVLLLAAGDYDLTAASFTNIESFSFLATAGETRTATYSSDAFDDATVQIDGNEASGGVSNLVISVEDTGADMFFNGLTFRDWDSADSITINGSAVNDDIRGTSQIDSVNGGDGNDRYFLYSDDIGSFENDSFDGGADGFTGGDDTGDQIIIRTQSSGTNIFDLRSMSITDVEELELQGGAGDFNTVIRLNAAQVGNGGLADNTVVFFGSFNNIATETYTLQFEMGTETSLDLSAWDMRAVAIGQDTTEINGDGDTETITGSSIRDRIFTRGGDDVVFGLGGDDDFNLYGGAETVDGGDGVDTVSYLNNMGGIVIDLTDGANSTGFAQGDSYTSIEAFAGTLFNDVFYADDTETALLGYDGTDKVSYLRATEGVTVNMTSGLRLGAFAIGDTFNDIETWEGSNFADLFFGTAAAERFEGADGNDNLQGRAGNDKLYGENGEDRLDGGGDNDQIFGGADDDVLIGNAGDDRLWGGTGADNITGGSGRDRAEYGGASVGVTVNMLNVSLNTGDAFGDTYISLEDLGGSAHADNLTGDNGVNRIFGNDGDDVLYGEGGQDRLFGGDGDDTAYGGDAQDELQGGDGADILYGNTGNDKLIGGAGNDELWGGNDNDFLSGGAGDDKMVGGNGNDRMFGGEGADQFIGNLGIDRADYSTSSNAVTLSLISGGTAGEALGDSFSSIEWVYGSDFNDDLTLNNLDGGRLYGGQGSDTLNGGNGEDRLYGGANADYLYGNDGKDRLYGGASIDTLDGGAGNDQLFGGSETDIFVFNTGYDRDTIYDFNDGVDFLTSSTYTLAEVTAALAGKSQVGLSTQLDFGNGDVLILRNMDIADVTIDDFDFGAI